MWHFVFELQSETGLLKPAVPVSTIFSSDCTVSLKVLYCEVAVFEE